MREALRQVMLRAEGAGELAGEGVRHGRAEHPVCGDEVDLDLRLEEGRIAALSWRAQGCPATMAVAAASSVLVGLTLDQAKAALDRRLQELGGLDRVEQHAARLFLCALERAGAA